MSAYSNVSRLLGSAGRFETRSNGVDDENVSTNYKLRKNTVTTTRQSNFLSESRGIFRNIFRPNKFQFIANPFLRSGNKYATYATRKYARGGVTVDGQ